MRSRSPRRRSRSPRPRNRRSGWHRAAAAGVRSSSMEPAAAAVADRRSRRRRSCCDPRRYTGGMDSQIVVMMSLAAVAVALAVLAWSVRSQAVRGGGRELEAVAAERARLEQELEAAREAAQARPVEAGTLNGRLQSLHKRLAEREEALESLRQPERRLREAAEADRLAATQARANLEHAERANRQMQAFLEEAQARLSAAFTELAGKVFKEKGEQFEKNVREATGQSRSDIEQLLRPFADRIKDFRKRVDTLYDNEARERASLLGAVNELKGLNQDMAE